jgi:site-specific DNA recombinase
MAPIGRQISSVSSYSSFVYSGDYHRDHLSALAQRVEVGTKGVGIILVEKRASAHARRRFNRKMADFGVPRSLPKWRTRHDSNV